MQTLCNTVERRPLVVLMGLFAEDWAERIPYEHFEDVSRAGSEHPAKVIEGVWGLILAVRNNGTPYVFVTNRLESIHALNNSIRAFGLGAVEISGILKTEFRLDPKNVIAYLCDSDTDEPVCVSDKNTGYISEEPLSRHNAQLQMDTNQICAALEEKAASAQ